MADGLDFGIGSDLYAGTEALSAPPMTIPNFKFDFPTSMASDMNIGNLAAESGVGRFNPDLNMGNVNFGSTDTYTPPPPAGSPPPGDKSTFQTISDYAKTAAPILGLGTTAAQVPLQLAQLSQTGRAVKAQEGAVATEREAAAPAIAAEQQLLPAGTKALLAGELPPELQTMVNDQVNQWTQQQLQTLTAKGIDEATARAMIQQQADELRNTLTINAAESLMAGGEGAAGTASGAASAGGTIASVGASANPLQAANQALARLSAST